MFMDVSRNTYPAGLGERLHACGHVHAIAVKIIAIDDHVAQAYTDTQGNPPIFGYVCVAPNESALDLDRALDRIIGASEFSEGTVTGILEDPPAELRGLGLEKLTPKRLELRQRPGLVLTHHSAEANHVGR